MIHQKFGVIRVPAKFRTLTKCHTEKWRIRRILKNTTLIGTEALLCVEQRRLFASYIRYFIFKVFISKLSGSRTLHLFHSLYRRHLPDIMFSSVLIEPPCALQLRALVFHSIFWKNLIKGIERLAHDVRMPRTSCVDTPHTLCGWCITLMNEIHSHTYKAYKGLTINQLYESFVRICL